MTRWLLRAFRMRHKWGKMGYSDRLLVCCLALFAVPSLWADEEAAALHIRPSEIGVNLFYNGTAVHIDGLAPSGYDVALVCRGKEQTVELKKKGKVFGFLWMNVGDVVFKHVPSFYAVITSNRIENLAPPEVLEKLAVGYRAIGCRCGCGCGACAPGESCPMFKELIRLREKEQLFCLAENAAKLEPQPQGRTWVAAECWLPANAPPGDYEVLLFSFKDREGKLLASKPLNVKPSGLAEMIASLAREHGLLYGILAAIIALLAGLATGFVFGLGTKAKH